MAAMRKRIATAAKVEDACGATDFLSQLPDDLLSHLLSFLQLRDAVRAKLLSRRWKHLYPANPVISFPPCECSGSCACAQSKDHKDSFLARVGKLMRQFRAPKIKAFELFIAYNGGNCTDCASLLDEWIRLACLMNAERIDLSLQDFPAYESYTFPLHLLQSAGPSNLRDLGIAGCTLPPFSSLAGPMTSLRTLQLLSVRFHENSVTSEDIASYFPNLEKLHLFLHNCEQLTSMRHLGDFCGRLISLKSLCITILSSVGLEFFEIDDTNLTDLTSVGGAKRLFFKGLKGLQCLDIYADISGKCAANFLLNLPEEFPQLASLSIFGFSTHHTYCSKDFRFPSFTSSFMCLKYLSLTLYSDTDLQNLSKILQVAPLLQQFDVSHVTLSEKSEQWSAAWLEERLLPQYVVQNAYGMHHVHLHLRKIDFETSSYFGKNEVELIIMLLKYATSLKKTNLIGRVIEYLKELQSALAPYFPRVNFATKIRGTP